MESITIHFRRKFFSLKNDAFFASNVLKTFCTKQGSAEISYPTITDTSYAAKKDFKKRKWHEKIRSLPTVEEKLIEMNMPSYYGWKTLDLREGVIPYDSLSFVQSITRTHFIKMDDIFKKDATQEFDRYCSQVVNKLKPFVLEYLLFYLQNKRLSPDEESEVGSLIVRQLNTLFTANLTKDAPHLIETQVDYDPRVEAFWVVGGMEPTHQTMKSRKGVHWMKDAVMDPVDRMVQYVGYPMMQLRHSEPLLPLIDVNDCENSDLTVPFFKYDPRVLGLQNHRRHGTSIPGFWPGDACEFSLMSYHTCNHLKNRPHAYGATEHAEALHCQAILASFGWLFPLACYQGFSTFCDVTYPSVTQTVITDGQQWSFYTYQLNTTLLHSGNCKDNPRRNICWGTHALKLFDAIEDGKIIGFNEDVLKLLVKMYLNKPKMRNAEMKPYLSEHRHVANIPDEEKRMWLERRFKHLYSLRPRHRPEPEIYHWEKIYKIDHKTRPIEARRRPFELGIDPYSRRLDQHQPPYVPKALRAHKKQKWSKMYYP